MRRLALFAVALLVLTTVTRGQQSTSDKQPASGRQPAVKAAQEAGSAARPTGTPDDNDQDVVRLSITLVQLDVVVTDKSGKHVTDLLPEDFEVLEDGKPQKITNFSYINIANAAPVVTPDPDAPAVPVKPDSSNVRRTIALVVDDLGLSFESTANVQDALRKFVDEQMQPGDLVAIVRTGAGIGALQQFTTDKRLLRAAIERVKWNSFGRGGIGAFSVIAGPRTTESADEGQGADAKTPFDVGPDEAFRNQIFSVGTLGAINYVVRGLRQLPGRKSVILFSDGFRLEPEDDRGRQVIDALTQLTDQANRASVVIYTVDARGLQVPLLNAQDDLRGLSAEEIDNRVQARSAQITDSQHTLNYLAQRTGGFPILNTNKIDQGVEQVLQDQMGYYLVGYVPNETTFQRGLGPVRFRKLEIRVKRPGLTARTRSGFYGVPDEQLSRRPLRTPVQQMLSAVTSPFASGDIGLRLSSVFVSDKEQKPFVRSLLHIDTRDLTFNNEPDGWKKAGVEVLAVTFGDNGQIVNQTARGYEIRANGDDHKRLLESGLLYTVNVPVNKAGAYQLRIAVRDTNGRKIGSANQFIEVPDVRKKGLALSGIVLTAAQAPGAASSPPANSQLLANKEGAVDGTTARNSTVTRRFKVGSSIDYSFFIYNARSAKQPQLTTQMVLFRDGRRVFGGQQRPYELKGQTDTKRLFGYGGLVVGRDLKPGDYVLQILVRDLAEKDKKKNIATQWAEFEVVP